MDIDQVIKNWEADPEIATNLACWVRTPPKAADFANFPFDLEPILVQNLRAQGIEALFSHQAKAFELLKQGENLVIATGTASGKTLCYNLPVLDTLLKDSLGTALYLFPTKALAQDQVSIFRPLSAEMKEAMLSGSVSMMVIHPLTKDLTFEKMPIS
jgi:DEAD/DEAH box helicase domain-containing protein